jgi:hypothetical protein
LSRTSISGSCSATMIIYRTSRRMVGSYSATVSCAPPSIILFPGIVCLTPDALRCPTACASAAAERSEAVGWKRVLGGVNYSLYGPRKRSPLKCIR